MTYILLFQVQLIRTSWKNRLLKGLRIWKKNSWAKPRIKEASSTVLHEDTFCGTTLMRRQILKAQKHKKKKKKNHSAGAELGVALFQHQLSNATTSKPSISIYTATTGGVTIVACDRSGKAVRLNEPQLATALTMRNVSGFDFEPPKTNNPNATGGMLGYKIIKTNFPKPIIQTPPVEC